MGTYYYLKDPKSEGGLNPVYEDDYFGALFSIAEKHGLKITDKMILDEIYKEKVKMKFKITTVDKNLTQGYSQITNTPRSDFVTTGFLYGKK